MSTLWQDLRYGLHMLARNPGFTLVAVLTLALGIGANTALFSVVDAVLLKKLPVRDPDRLVLFGWNAPSEFSAGGYTGNSSRDPKTGVVMRTSFPFLTLTRFREQRGVLSDVFAYGTVGMNLNAGGQAEVVQGQAVSGNYYSALGVAPFLGRTMNDGDDNAAANPVAVLSHRFWERRFNGDRGVVGRQVNLNNVAFTIVGVTPPGFEGTTQVGESQDVSIPIAWEPQVSGDRSRTKGAGVWWLRLMGRLKPGATEEQARATLEGVFQESAVDHRQARQVQAQAEATAQRPNPITPLQPKDYPHLAASSGSQGEMNTRQYFARPLRLLLGVVGLVLLIACANVANLLLVRGSARQKEIAVRLAVGASRWRLIRQLLTESLLLGTLGGAAGILFALWIKDGLLAASDWGGREMPALDSHLDLRVLGFTLVLSLLTAVLFGVVPALRATQLQLTPALKDSGKTSSGASRSLLSKSLVVAQVSLSLLLLIGAGLLLRTLQNLRRVEAGFNARNLLLFRVEPTLIGYKDERLVNLYKQISARLEAIPGVAAVTFSRVPLLAQSSSSRSLYFRHAGAGTEGEPKADGDLYIHQVRENFFEAMEIPLLLGRTFNPNDDNRAPKVAVVNQAFGRTYFPNQNPIGKRFGSSPDKPEEIEIVGLARDAKYTRQRDETPPTAYLPWQQEGRAMGTLTFEVRTAGDPTAFTNGVRQAVREIDSNLPLREVKTQIEQADETMAIERLLAKLLSLFGLLAQQLASIGLYGLLAWSVSQRTHEIGIRMALGADRSKVLRMIMKQGMTLTLIGVALGLSGAYVLTKYLESLTTMLFGVQPRDPLTYGVAAALLTVVALVACFVPARRATKVDPMVALRYE